MKSLVTFFSIISLFTLVYGTNLNAQSREIDSPLTQVQKERLHEISEELFQKVPPIGFDLISYDLSPSLDSISEPQKYGQKELDSLFELLNADQSNPVILMKIAQFYDNTNKSLLAQSYYEKAFSNIDVKSLNDDKAALYSLSAVLKNRLGKPDAMKDLEKSLEINPNDSLAIQIYPNLLLTRNDYDKAKEILVKALEEGSGNILLPYMKLLSFEFIETAKNISIEKNGGVNIQKKYNGKNYDEIFDYTLMRLCRGARPLHPQRRAGAGEPSVGCR